MFEHLKDYKKIFVVGLGRSGTRIATRMIAQDTGKDFIDETEWGVHDIDKLKHINKYRSNFVIQANSAYYCIGFFSRSDTLIVYVKRDLEEIKASWARLRNLGSLNTSMWSNIQPQLLITNEERLAIMEAKKEKIKNLLEIQYNDLKGHPLWLDSEVRANFRWYQTSTEQPEAMII